MNAKMSNMEVKVASCDPKEVLTEKLGKKQHVCLLTKLTCLNSKRPFSDFTEMTGILFALSNRPSWSLLEHQIPPK